LQNHHQQIQLDAALIEQAKRPILRMLNFSAAYKRFQQHHPSAHLDLAEGIAQFSQWLAAQTDAGNRHAEF
ncbi:MAG: hypothetical protein QM666_11315, partial [Acinetobacter sp.]